MIHLADDCPGCVFAAEIMRQTADRLAGVAGGIVGTAIGARRGKPVEGALLGQQLAPQLIERGALAIAGAVKKKRRQSKGQKSRARNMSKAMKKANSMGRLKSGSYRKGWDAKRVMRTAHRLCK